MRRLLRLSRWNSRGVSLLELIASVVILIVIVVSVASVLNRSSVESTQSKLRTTGGEYATSRLEELKQIPYPAIPMTPQGTWFDGTSCDCSAVKFDDPNYPTDANGYPGIFRRETTINDTTYQVRTCINRVQFNGTGWTPSCENQEETGMKNIVVRTNWGIGKSSRTFRTETLVSQNTGDSAFGQIVVVPCVANAPPAGTTCSATNLGNIVLGVYNASFRDVRSANSNSPYTFNVPIPGVYTVQAQVPGHLPYRQVITRNNTLPQPNIQATLQAFTDVTTLMGGEMNTRRGWTISKVIAQVQVTNPVDPTEVLELTNTSGGTLAVPNATNLRATYVTRTNPGGTWVAGAGTEGYLSTSFIGDAYMRCETTGPPYTLGPACGIDVADGQSLLIMGVKDVQNPTNNPWSIMPDIWYPAAADYIRLEGSGVQVETGPNLTPLIDNVRWTGPAGTLSNPVAGKTNNWEGTSLPLNTMAGR